MKNKMKIGVILALLIVALFSWMFWGGSIKNNQEVSSSSAIDTVLDFYDPWLAALQDANTDPYKLGLDKNPILSKELRNKISDAKGYSGEEPDPVLCQTTIPTNISGNLISESENKAEVLILSRDKDSDRQAIVKLMRLNDGWFIDDIKCSLGEFEPEREFTFERTGNLLKSVPQPYNSKYWHLIFEENSELGHVAPLFFNSESVCILSNGDSDTCNPDYFLETTEVTVYGDMSESGVTVKKLEFKE